MRQIGPLWNNLLKVQAPYERKSERLQDNIVKELKEAIATKARWWIYSRPDVSVKQQIAPLLSFIQMVKMTLQTKVLTELNAKAPPELRKGQNLQYINSKEKNNKQSTVVS